MILSVAKDFSTTPGARNPEEGSFSGEEFLAIKLEPAFKDALAAKVKLTVDLDATEGYATSFLEASFGGLARKFGIETVKQSLELISNDEPYLKDEVWSYVSKALDA